MGSRNKRDEDPGLQSLKERVLTLENAAAAQRRASEEIARVLAMHRELGWGILRSTSVRETSRHCAEAMVRHLGAALARIWILNERDNVLELEASAGLYSHIDGPHGRIRVGEFKIGMIAQSRQPHLTNSVIGDPRVPNQDWAKRERLVSFAGYPLLIDERLVGVVAIFSREHLSEVILHALQSVARHVAYAIDRVRHEQALRASESCFRALIEHSSDAIARLDAEGNIQFASGSTSRILGRDPAALKGTSAFALVHPEDEEAARRALSAVAQETGATTTIELRLSHRDGHWVWAECVLSNWLVDPSVRAVVVNWRDITERKRTEEAIRHSQKMASIGALAGGVAHDFNNLLTTILGNTEMARSMIMETDALYRPLLAVKEASQRASDLIRQLLAYAGRGRFVLEPVDLDEVVKEAAEVIELPNNVRLVLHLDQHLPSIKADAAQVEQIIANLMLNAAEAIEDGQHGTVAVSTRFTILDERYIAENLAFQEVPPGRYVTLEVNDNGRGIDPAMRDRIFDPFFTTKFQGRGLGLSAVLGAVKAHKGAVEVDSRPGRGTTFRVLFPPMKP